jgi:uncharacterized metal-binding protein YceD (DUF177 family)
MTDAPTAPEFSRILEADRLNGETVIQTLTATPEERAAVAARLGLDALDSLTARLRAVPVAGGAFIRVDGRYAASVTQTCGITLAPVVSAIEESLERTYTFEEGPRPGAGREVDLEADGEEPADPIIDGRIDLGELVVEELSLAIDPFPRAAGAVFDAAAHGVAEKKDTPFAALVQLRTKKK